MITVNNVTLRNLQEQVLENKQKIAEHYSTDRVIAEFGIRVVGKVSSSTGLPGANATYPLPAAPDYPGEYGDAYLVGTAEPYNMWIYSRPDPNSGYITNYWINVGPLNVIGPEGPQGEKGDKGDKGTRGSLWYAGASIPSFTANVEDKYVITSGANTGTVYTYTETGWSQIGSIRGPQGIQGIQGPIGLTGPQGPQGAAGKDGAPGQSFHVEGILANTEQLPTPTQAIRAGAYLVGNDIEGYDLYIIIGGHNEGDELLWFNAGKVEGVEGPQGPQGPQGIQGEPGVQITSIQLSSSSETTDNRTLNTIRVVMSDGSTRAFGVYAQNGAQGATGPAGQDGAQGPQGDPGPQGPAGTSISSIEQVAIGSDDEYTQTSLKAIMSDGTEVPFSVAAKNGTPTVPTYTAVIQDNTDCNIGEVTDQVFNLVIDRTNTTKSWNNYVIFTYASRSFRVYGPLVITSGLIILPPPASQWGTTGTAGIVLIGANTGIYYQQFYSHNSTVTLDYGCTAELAYTNILTRSRGIEVIQVPQVSAVNSAPAITYNKLFVAVSGTYSDLPFASGTYSVLSITRG